MIKAILFDCGGVLVYPKGGYWPRAVDRNEILGGRHIEIDRVKADEAMKKQEHFVDEGQMISGLRHELKQRIMFLSAMNEELEAGITDEEIEKIAHSLTYNDERYALYDDTRRMLKEIGRSYRIGFLSNAMPSMVRALNNSGITDGLDCFTVSCLIGCQKPDEGIYLAALNEIGLEPEECVFIDDLRDNLLTAARLNMNVIRMKRDFYLCEPAADFEWSGSCAKDLSEVKRLVDIHNSGTEKLKPCL